MMAIRSKKGLPGPTVMRRSGRAHTERHAVREIVQKGKDRFARIFNREKTLSQDR